MLLIIIQLYIISSSDKNAVFFKQLLEMKEIDFVILLYSHGTACLHTGTHEVREYFVT